eukprot:15452704-Alexandrium_andersonii.AAC.1
MRAAEAAMYAQEFEERAGAEEGREMECQRPGDLLVTARERRRGQYSSEQLSREQPIIAAEAAKQAARVGAAVR